MSPPESWCLRKPYAPTWNSWIFGANVGLALENIEILEEREALTQSRYESGLIDALGPIRHAPGLCAMGARGLPQLEARLAEAEARAVDSARRIPGRHRGLAA